METHAGFAPQRHRFLAGSGAGLSGLFYSPLENRRGASRTMVAGRPAAFVPMNACSVPAKIPVTGLVQMSERRGMCGIVRQWVKVWKGKENK